jgi:nicotinamide mononucleotide (NMN) deamidase PncC
VPVGTVFVALATGQQTRCERRHWRWDRDAVRRFAAHQALDFLRKQLAGHPS